MRSEFEPDNDPLYCPQFPILSPGVNGIRTRARTAATHSPRFRSRASRFHAAVLASQQHSNSAQGLERARQVLQTHHNQKTGNKKQQGNTRKEERTGNILSSTPLRRFDNQKMETPFDVLNRQRNLSTPQSGYGSLNVVNSRLDGKNSDGWSRNGDEDSGSSTPFQAKKEGGWAGQKRRRNGYLYGSANDLDLTRHANTHTHTHTHTCTHTHTHTLTAYMCMKAKILVESFLVKGRPSIKINISGRQGIIFVAFLVDQSSQ